MNHHQLFEGFVQHRRLEPKLHSFRHPIFQFYLDLDHLNEISDASPFLSLEKINYVSFYRKNYFDKKTNSLKKAILEKLGISIDYDNYKIYLLTNLSFLGLCFNPISIYFIFKGGALYAMIAEVTNTPWRERHCYVLDKPIKYEPPIYYFQATKELHVSPFMGMDYEYRFKLKKTEDQIILHIENVHDGRITFDATLSMLSMPFSQKNIHTLLKRHPLLTHKTIALIHWHAIKLWFKGVPFHPHPKTQ
ncbi:MAG: DUF1365 domain-containing protein [Candidatus Berkiella sp.]